MILKVASIFPKKKTSKKIVPSKEIVNDYIYTLAKITLKRIIDEDIVSWHLQLIEKQKPINQCNKN